MTTTLRDDYDAAWGLWCCVTTTTLRDVCGAALRLRRCWTYVVLRGDYDAAPLTVRFLTRRFIGEYENSADYKYRHMMSLRDEIVHLEVLDARSENDLSNDVIRWADGVCLVYSITDLSSFWTLRTWAHKIRECRKNLVCEFILVGNKQDLSHFRKISTENGRALASELGCSFFEVSAAEDYQSICDALCKLYQEVTLYKNRRKMSIFGRVFKNSHK
uniref:small monomeric GTPase n=1 Tax=Saccoglossus kowalevskii TaxID=10224 RepID=A0ABM0MT50_SACKO|nr:PREDICTED: ras-related and estrogen-regulated growth inhibitor-like protein-like [Saccoglossus kowalevskii]